MVKQKTEAQTDRYNRYGSPLQWVGATVIGSISAASTFINLVRTKFHEDNAFRQGFSVLHQAKNTELELLNDVQIEETLKILKTYVGDHPSYKNFASARFQLNAYLNEIRSEAATPPTLSVSDSDWNTESIAPAAQETEAMHGPHAKKAAEEEISSASNNLRNLQENYAKANEAFITDCKDGIDKAMRSPEYKKLAIRSSEKHSAVKVRFDKLSDSYAETMYGIKSKGILGHTQGVWERFVGFGDYTKRNMLFKTAVAFGVAFGGTMMVFNQLNTRDKLNEIDKQSERADRKIDALLEKSGIRDEDISTRAEHRIKVKQREKIEAAMTRKNGSHVAKIMEDRAEAAEASHSAAI